MTLKSITVKIIHGRWVRGGEERGREIKCAGVYSAKCAGVHSVKCADVHFAKTSYFILEKRILSPLVYDNRNIVLFLVGIKMIN